MTFRTPTWALLAAAVLAVAAARTATAAPTEVEVIYLVAHAHNNHSEIHRRLAPVARALQTLGFTGYDFISDGKWTMSVGDSKSVKLEGDYTLQIQLDEIGDASIRLTVWLARPDGTDPAHINLRIKPNAAVVFGGTDYKGGKLVVPIRVRYP